MSEAITEHARPAEPVATGADTVVVNQNVAPQQAGAFDDLVEVLPGLIKESKAGYKTTEFWLMIVISVLTVVDAIPLPEQYEAILVTALGVAYALSRGLAKKGVAVVEEPKGRSSWSDKA